MAVGSLLIGIGRAGLGLIYVSIGASILAIGFLLAALLRPPRREERGRSGAPG